MAAELGIFSLILAFVLSLSQAFFGLTGAWRGKAVWMAVARPAVSGQFVFVVMAFACLVYCFVHNDFSVLYVARNSNSQLPLFYQVAALWGAHEGSLLLWILILSIWSVAVAAFSRQLPLSFSSRVLGVMGLISAGFMLFTLWTSNPFTRLVPAAADGADLNPVLQDFALAIHPPMLYTGYVGFSVAFAFAIAAMLEGRLDQTWAKWTRPWTIFAWLFQTIGIALGSWWAYYELGWGGWWFWDPVENASFMPWLVGTALIHSLSVTEKRGIFKSWTLLLAIFAFLLESGGDLFGALRRVGFGALVCDRSDPRPIHPRLPRPHHRRFADTVCVAGAEALRARGLRAVLAGVLSAGEQRDPGERRRTRALGHAVAPGV
jgi:cytochrome c-type biogenesis protein CcmF